MTKQQLKASKDAAADLRAMLSAEPDSNIPTGLVAANRNRLRKKLAKIEKDIEKYEMSQGEFKKVLKDSKEDEA